MKGVILTIMLVFLAACSSTPTGNVVGPVDTDPEPEQREFLNGGYHEVLISEFYFKPKSITVYQGDRVKWINDMIFVKRIWIWGEEPGQIIREGKSWSYIFLETGVISYRDFFYQDMQGNVTVLPYEERPDIKAKLEAEARSIK